ncbi:3-oxoacyl-ACP reductase [Nocardioides silvaticus]|uniref:3-oxoacyl-ACP reductase n=1 Tax=Nocardioides silvaticus TaxID=2201891 RepID=A0A316TTV4_9ACTN|nr:SDR family oxidoreductase [Nocardioides silvaticus]PWN02936.1 3-oxoacyl-ACP reductase [Nocardioides silvaticus]
MDLGIESKVALVTGGAGGLGSAIARALASEGAAVVVADLRGDAAEAVAAGIRDDGGTALGLDWELGDLDACGDRLATVESELGPVDILVNNTGGPPAMTVTEVTEDAWRDHFESMVLTVVDLTGRVVPGMRERGWGRVITSTSSGVVAPIPGLGLSNALRSTLLGWSKTLSREVARDGITCNIVVPGRIGTARTRHLDEVRAQQAGRPVEEVAEESASGIPLGRYGTPEEYATAVAFLAGRPASYITGSVVRVDGGLINAV